MGLFDNSSLGFSSANPFLNNQPVTNIKVDSNGNGMSVAGGTDYPTSAGSSNGSSGSTKLQAPAKTSGSSSNSSSSSKTLQAQQDKLRKSLGNSFGSTIDAYKNMIGWLPDQQNDVQSQVNNLADTQKQSISDALTSALQKFGGYRDEVATNQKQTLQDLSDNTRNLFQAGNNYLGARGAGDSSATGMYSAAMTQQANKQRADVQNQTNTMYNDLNTKEADTQSAAQQQLDAVETWKATRTSEIVQQYQDLKRQLETAKAQANDSQKQALANLDASLFQSAVNNLNTLQQSASQYKQQVAATLQTQNQQLSGALDNVNKSAQYDVQKQTTVPLSGIEQATPQSDGSVVGYYNGRKVQVDKNGNVLAYLD